MAGGHDQYIIPQWTNNLHNLTDGFLWLWIFFQRDVNQQRDLLKVPQSLPREAGRYIAQMFNPIDFVFFLPEFVLLIPTQSFSVQPIAPADYIDQVDQLGCSDPGWANSHATTAE